jgi:hypothetical protein
LRAPRSLTFWINSGPVRGLVGVVLGIYFSV